MTKKDIFNVVILYDKFAAGDQAMALYVQLTRDLAGECRPQLSLWRFDMAAAAELAPKVNQDLAAADLILVAGQGRLSCPSTFGGGPDRSGQPKGAPSHVLVVLLEVEGEPDSTSDAWIELLRPTIARRPTEIFEWRRHAREHPAHPPDWDHGPDPQARALESQPDDAAVTASAGHR